MIPWLHPLLTLPFCQRNKGWNQGIISYVEKYKTTVHSITAKKEHKRLKKLNFEKIVHSESFGSLSDTTNSDATYASRDVIDSPMRSPHWGGIQKVAKAVRFNII